RGHVLLRRARGPPLQDFVDGALQLPAADELVADAHQIHGHDVRSIVVAPAGLRALGPPRRRPGACGPLTRPARRAPAASPPARRLRRPGRPRTPAASRPPGPPRSSPGPAA